VIRALWVFVLGLISSGGFAPIDRWWLFPTGLALFILHTINQKFGVRLTNSLLFGLGFFAPMLHWSSSFVGALPWLLLTILCALFYLPLGALLKSSRWLWLTFPALFVAIEFFRNRFPFGGFAWGRAGYLGVDSPYSELIPYIGVAGGSFLFSLAAVALYRIISGFRIYWIPIFIVLAFIPNYQLPSTGSITITSIQGNVPRLGYEISTQVRKVFENHANKTLDASSASASSPPDLYIWPEDGADIDPLKGGREEISQLVARVNAPIIFGSVGRDNLDRPVNLSILWRQGGIASIYQKQHLAPFGEYIPLRRLAASLSPLVDQVTDFHPGSGWKYHFVDKAIIAPLICFEVADDHLIRQAVPVSNIFIAQTNNATYGRSAQSAQQLQITRSRALEYHRSIASISTVGISAMVDSHGRIPTEVPPYTSAWMTAELELYEGATPAHRNGLGVEYGSLAIAAGALISGLSRLTILNRRGRLSRRG
jgi:apolipoprotein N-acyltransferase